MTSIFFKTLAFFLAETTPMDFLHSTGKIYSVVVGIVVIFLGILIYLIRLDRKLTKIETQIKDEHKTS
ncbi:MAG: CcmD family protein [Saprospiraceae bacterium]|nr:CcmD family protein [Saprospiraceae bacterium]MBK8632823.1 CcmD family protein [Saprospiraceae bacterium]MBP7641710.1 CcmD family protein [Saprospiraceae bacterium]HPN71822.1 CcmD family protein [Saprospiraceae bacterium]